MKTSLFSIMISFGMVINLALGQETSYLAQKLMLENDLRMRINSALEKVLEDHRYVLDVSVELSLTPTVKEEVTFQPTSAEKGVVEKPEKVISEKPSVVPEEGKGRRSRLTGIPIPGFDFQIEEEPEETTPPAPIVPEKEEEVEQAVPPAARVVSQSYTDITTSKPVIEKLEISCILPKDSSPELIENVRQIIMVASHFDRSRGDVLSIMTASFKERKDERTAESIILRSIAEKIDKLEKKKEKGEVATGVDWREEFVKWQEEEAKRREEDRAAFLAELKKLEDERALRNLEREKKAILKRDSLKTEEINRLKEMLASASLSTKEVEAAQEEVEAKEKEKARLDSLKKKMEEFEAAMLQDTEEWFGKNRGGVSNLPIYLMSAISLLAVIALAAVIIFNGRKPKYVMPPPWAVPRPPRKKKVAKKPMVEKGGERVAAVSRPGGTPTTGVPTPPSRPEAPSVMEDPSVLQSEIKSVRQSIVSMSVGQPEAATSIVKEWLQEEAPPPPETPAVAPTPPAEKPPEEEGGKKKKKKKK